MQELIPAEVTHIYLGVFYKVSHRMNVDKCYEVVEFWNGERWVRTFCNPPIKDMEYVGL